MGNFLFICPFYGRFGVRLIGDFLGWWGVWFFYKMSYISEFVINGAMMKYE